ncbi:MAG: discoidin domain-containing protein, partial [Candidatus Rokuibacteriota bacterium]
EYLVYSRFVAPTMPTSPLSRAGWRVAASVAGEPAERAIDGVRNSRWSSVGAAPQTPGMWFMVNLDTPAAISAIELDFGGSIQDYPRGLALAVSADGERWEEVSPTITRLGRLYWTGTHAIRGGVQRMVLRFPARTARFVRLQQTGTDFVFGWSIHELNVYPPT